MRMDFMGTVTSNETATIS